jgi:predicted ATPase
LDRDGDLGDTVLKLLDWVSDVDVTDAAGPLLSAAVPRGKYLLRFTDRFMTQRRNTLSAYDASEGALYVLFSAVLCLSPASPGLIAVDNLDQALNPRLIARLTERLSHWLQVGGTDRQLLFTAHNPAVLDGLDLTDDEVRLFAVDRDSNGHTCCRRIRPTKELLTLQTDYPLSRLWLMGRLGAIPNV